MPEQSPHTLQETWKSGDREIPYTLSEQEDGIWFGSVPHLQIQVYALTKEQAQALVVETIEHALVQHARQERDERAADYYKEQEGQRLDTLPNWRFWYETWRP